MDRILTIQTLLNNQAPREKKKKERREPSLACGEGEKRGGKGAVLTQTAAAEDDMLGTGEKNGRGRGIP